MTKQATITDYQLLDHGIDGSQYFPGCGVYGTSFDHVVTGCGDNFSEAINDALESMAQGVECNGVDIEAFEHQMLTDEGLLVDGEPPQCWPHEPSANAVARKSNGDMSEEEWENADCDVYYYVSIRYNVA